ncbi:hypothetical protein CACET_c08200 [Clostridium aceticum]|uniref:Uncharacterized protein n=1 Tax=Clostridium aceticum TaxID=84022 RepID=A0A0D8I7A1_9CLOT|nr:hypothetical protein [Clostridium aceticum]AKL94329.1 hypothetical protein CACET_c08200 [Clostridium aceticum]KJF26170.1 hypothetical protein TZ02_15105 [Clostridium aceticum]
MKKVYYVDSILLILSTVLFITFVENIDDIINRAIFLLFISGCIYANIKMSIVIKYPPKHKLAAKEKTDVFLLILGKIYFLIMMIRFGYYLSDGNDLFILLVFMFHGSLILDYTYIHNNYLITIKRKPIHLHEILEFEMEKQFLNQKYLHAKIKEKGTIRFCLSEYEYENFKNAIEDF